MDLPGHFAVGYIITIGTITFIQIAFEMQRRLRFKFLVLISLFAGFWAIIPDLDHIIKTSFHYQNFTNIFFLHQILDDLDVVNRLYFSAEMVVIAITLTFFIWIFYYEPLRIATLETPLDKDDFWYPE